MISTRVHPDSGCKDMERMVKC